MHHKFYILSLVIICLWVIETDSSFGQSSNSQDKSIANLSFVQATPDTSTVNDLLEKARIHKYNNPDSSLVYATDALSKAQKIDYTSGILEANYLIGTAYFYKGDYERVLAIATDLFSHKHGNDHKKEWAQINKIAGMAHGSMGSYKPSLSYFLKAKNLFESIGDEDGTFVNLNNVGVLYLKLENYHKALDIFVKLDSLRPLQASTISIPVNLGFIYYELGEYDKAEENLNRILNFKGTNFDRRAVGLSTFKLGQIYSLRGDYDKAVAFFKRSIAVYKDLDNELEQVQSLNGIAQTYLDAGNAKDALSYAKQALAIAQKHNALPQKKTSSEALYKIYDSQNNASEALKYHVMFKRYSDSLLNDEQSKEIGRLEAKNDFDKQEAKLRETQTEKNLQNKNKIARQRLYFFIALALLLIAIIVGYLFYRNAKLRKKANGLLKEKNDEIALQAERLQELNEIKNHLFSIISHDLRGPLGSLQGLIELHEMDDLTHEDLEVFMPELSQKFKYTSELLTNLLTWSKSQLEGYSINAQSFDFNDIAKKILPLITSKAEQKNISVSNNIQSKLFMYADPRMIELVLLNLLSNAVKFTPEQGHVELTSNQQNGTVKICVVDNGVGIGKGTLKNLLEDHKFYSTVGTKDEKGTGLGLMLCKDFIEKNNGTLKAKSTLGKGSTFCFVLPTAKRKSTDNK